LTALVLASGCGGSSDPTPIAGQSGDAIGTNGGDTQFAVQAVSAISSARATARSCGAKSFAPAVAVSWSGQLAQAALTHASWMQANEQFSHTGENGSDVGIRATAAGYAWRTIGENIAGGHPDMASVVQAWIDSPGHCANLMSPDFREIGLARVDGQPGNTFSTYWTLVLGAR